jgi:Uma2 family endonuclease
MSQVSASAAITDAELLRLSASAFVEVANGEIVTMSPTGFLHSVVTGNIYDILRAHVRQHRLGYVAGDSLIYVLRRDGDGIRTARVPDVSFVRRGSIPTFDFDKPFPGAPALAVEVVSPSESEEETLAKIRDYLAYGTEEAWVVYPNQGEVHVYRQDDPKTIRVYNADDVLEPAALLPGLRIQVSGFFTLPE